jgi:pseudouridine-5'-phosphate glycosidase
MMLSALKRRGAARGAARAVVRAVARSLRHISTSHLHISPEVTDALRSKKPVVALESTIISHGMPYPDNLACALDVEAVVREHGAVPATVALIHGRVCVGLSATDLSLLAKAGEAARKCSRRDLAAVIARGEVGATTVSGTMVCAAAAGIRVFVTGGIGGVHRGGEVRCAGARYMRVTGHSCDAALPCNADACSRQWMSLLT